MSYLDTLGLCQHAVDSDGFLGWFENLGACEKQHPMPSIGMSFVNVETRSLWLHDGAVWHNSTQGNPFTMIVESNQVQSVRSGYAKTFYHCPKSVGRITLTVQNEEGRNYGAWCDVESIGDIVFLEWTGSSLNIAVRKIDPRVALFDGRKILNANGEVIVHDNVVYCNEEGHLVDFEGKQYKLTALDIETANRQEADITLLEKIIENSNNISKEVDDRKAAIEQEAASRSEGDLILLTRMGECVTYTDDGIDIDEPGKAQARKNIGAVGVSDDEKIANLIEQLVRGDGNGIYPRTDANAVYVSNLSNVAGTMSRRSLHNILEQTVLTQPMDIDDSRKQQARKNIGAVGVIGSSQGSTGRAVALEENGELVYPTTKSEFVVVKNKNLDEALAEKITVRSLSGEGELDYKGNVYYPRTKSGLVSHKGASLETVVDVLDSRSKETKQRVDTFLADADTSEKALDTLKELQSYIKSDETAASQMMQSISENSAKIDEKVGVLYTEHEYGEDYNYGVLKHGNKTLFPETKDMYVHMTGDYEGNTLDGAMEQVTHAIEKEATRAKQTETYLETQKADKTGYYENLSVGVADNLSGRDEATEREFVFSASGGANKSINDGTARITSIQGNSLVWNQSITSDTRQATSPQVISGYYLYRAPQFLGKNYYLRKEHKYLFIFNVYNKVDVIEGTQLTRIFGYSSVNGTESYIGKVNSIIKIPNLFKKGRNTYSYIYDKTDNAIHIDTIYLDISQASDNTEYSEFKAYVVDLTQMFGAGNEPTTVEEFEARCPKNVSWEYNEGTIINNNTTAIKSTGFNAWDEEWEFGGIGIESGNNFANAERIRSKNYCKCLPNTTYYVQSPLEINIIWYDSDKKYSGYNYCYTVRSITSPSNACYFKINTYADYGITYNHDICINLSHTGYRNGEYKPYETFTRQLPTVEGGLKSAGSVADEIRYNTTTRKWEYIKRVGVVDLGTLSWWYGNPSGNTKKVFSSNDVRAQLGIKEPLSDVAKQNLICNRYAAEAVYNVLVEQEVDSSITVYNQGEILQRIVVSDTAYADAETFKQSLQGVELYYELAEPVVTELDSDTTDFNGDYEVWDFGTEEAIQDVPSSPCRALVKYGFNAVDQIRNNEVNIESLLARVAQLEAQFSAMQVAQTNAEEVIE